MTTLVIFIAYTAYTLFWGRILLHAIVWCRASDNIKDLAHPDKRTGPIVLVLTLLDLLFFRRLFNSDKALWFGSWPFHLCMLLVILRHMKYFMEPVPVCVRYVQPFGLAAGYALPFTAAYLIIFRLLSDKKDYVSPSNYFVLASVLLISISGVLMRTYFRAGLPDVKGFIMGILTFSPQAVPASPLFILHFLMLIVLIPVLPSHMFAAPVVALFARKRDEELGSAIHE